MGDIRGELLSLDDGIKIMDIGDDYAVYVDALDGPTSIVGYRDGDTWFNASGTEINDPDILAVNKCTRTLLKEGPMPN